MVYNITKVSPFLWIMPKSAERRCLHEGHIKTHTVNNFVVIISRLSQYVDWNPTEIGLNCKYLIKNDLHCCIPLNKQVSHALVALDYAWKSIAQNGPWDGHSVWVANQTAILYHTFLFVAKGNQRMWNSSVPKDILRAVSWNPQPSTSTCRLSLETGPCRAWYFTRDNVLSRKTARERFPNSHRQQQHVALKYLAREWPVSRLSSRPCRLRCGFETAMPLRKSTISLCVLFCAQSMQSFRVWYLEVWACNCSWNARSEIM